MTDQEVSQDEANALWEKQESLRMQLGENEEEIEITLHTQEGEELWMIYWTSENLWEAGSAKYRQRLSLSGARKSVRNL